MRDQLQLKGKHSASKIHVSAVSLAFSFGDLIVACHRKIEEYMSKSGLAIGDVSCFTSCFSLVAVTTSQ